MSKLEDRANKVHEECTEYLWELIVDMAKALDTLLPSEPEHKEEPD
jgi:hypothetical protein